MNEIDWNLFKDHIGTHKPCRVLKGRGKHFFILGKEFVEAGVYYPDTNAILLDAARLKSLPLRKALSVFHHECWHQRFEQKYLDNVSSYRFSCIKPLGQSERMEPIIEELFCRLFGWHDSIKALIEIRQGK